MRALLYATAASWMVLAPAAADEGRTGRGADADGHALLAGDRAAEMQSKRGSGSALLMVQALVDQLVAEGTLSRDGAARVLDRAKALSAAERPIE